MSEHREAWHTWSFRGAPPTCKIEALLVTSRDVERIIEMLECVKRLMPATPDGRRALASDGAAREGGERG